MLDFVNGAGVRTFYVPTNAAFEALAATRGLADANALLNELDLARIMRHHLVDGALHTPLLDGQRGVHNLLDEAILLRPQAETWTYGDASLNGDSIYGHNGVVQILDSAVNPPPDPMTEL